MKEDHKKSGDEKSLMLVACFLIKYGYVEVKYGYSGDGYDILGVKPNGDVHIFNVKQRHFASDRWGDLSLDEHDFNALQWAKGVIEASGKTVKCLYIHFFTNNRMFISNDVGWVKTTKFAPKTTMFGDNSYWEKTWMTKSQTAPDVKCYDLGKVSFDKLKNIYPEGTDV